MKQTIKEYWKANRRGYLITSIICSIVGFLIELIKYARVERLFDSIVLIVIPISFIGVFILMWLLFPIMR
jgi:hypothetical protein